jgi:uncharacterized membrane protein (UPF0127 family)
LLLPLVILCSKVKTQRTELSSKKSDNTIILNIKDKKIEVEVAKTEEERALGLMYRKSLNWNSGMLFLFEQETNTPFWMKNTYIPLSIAFIDKNNVIIDILEMTPNQEAILYAPSRSYLKALEMNRGWFLENGIKVGDTIYGIP